ncbi:hypothetical protein NFI96_019586 [Prochilodus magdalenae]|nr:hypothetical protein NFI96_019586 [Prochilodus magdalenae]
MLLHFRGNHTDPAMVVWKQRSASSDLSIVLIGEEFTGKSSAGNTILGRSEFPVDGTLEPLMARSGFTDGRNVIVVNTPGWDPACPPNVPLRILKRGCGRVSSLTDQGPHALLLTVPIFLNVEWNQKVATRLLRLFDDHVWRHTILLFTKADLLRLASLKEYLEGSGRPFQALLEKCEWRYHALNNREMSNHRQVSELLVKIDEMVTENDGKTFQMGEGSVWEEEILVESRTEAPKINALREQLNEIMERQAKLEEELSEWREREILLRPEKSMDSQEEYPDQNETWPQVDIEDPSPEYIYMHNQGTGFCSEDTAGVDGITSPNVHSEPDKSEVEELSSEALMPTVKQAHKKTMGTLSEDDCLDYAASTESPMSSNDEEDMQSLGERDSEDTSKAQGLVVMEQPDLLNRVETCADPEDRDHPEAVKTETLVGAFKAEQVPNKTDTLEDTFRYEEEACADKPAQAGEDHQLQPYAMFTSPQNWDHLGNGSRSWIVCCGQVYSYQQGAVRIDGLWVLTWWEPSNLFWEAAPISLLIDWTLIVIQGWFVICFCLDNYSQKEIPVAKLPELGLENRNELGFHKDEHPPNLVKQKREQTEDPLLPSDGDQTGKLDGEMLQPKASDHEEVTQDSLRGKDGVIPQHGKKSDGGLPQHNLREENKPQHSKASKRSGDKGTPQQQRETYDGEMPQCVNKMDDNRGMPQLSKSKSDGGISQKNRKKGGKGKSQCNERSAGEIPTFNRGKDAGGRPQHIRDKGDGGILQNCRKTADKKIAQCSRKKKDGGRAANHRGGDDRGRSPQSRKKSEMIPQHGMERGDLGIPQHSMERGDLGIPQHGMERGDLEIPQHGMEKGDLGIPQHSMERGDLGIPQHGMEKGDLGIPQHSMKKGDLGIPQHSMEKGDLGIPQHSMKKGDLGIPQHSMEKGDLGIPQHSMERGDLGIPQHSMEKGDLGIPQHSMERGDLGIPQQGMERGDLGIPQHRKQSDDDVMPKLVKDPTGLGEKNVKTEGTVRTIRRSQSLQRFLEFNSSGKEADCWDQRNDEEIRHIRRRASLDHLVGFCTQKESTHRKEAWWAGPHAHRPLPRLSLTNPQSHQSSTHQS